MTSKHLFFKAMKEDLRHKLWMIALSILGNFLLLPVGWMIWRSNELRFRGGVNGLLQMDERIIIGFRGEIAGFLGGYLLLAGGVIAIIGAIIAGLFGFRHLFHKNMVDAYHSLPVKRDTLYGVNYVNGILIWFVPFLVNLLLTFFLGCSLERQVGGSAMIPGMAADVFYNVILLTVVYLLVYHVVLVAVMLSGNVLNTLVSMMILGFGVMAFFGLGIAYFDTYMGTYYIPAVDFGDIVYGAPLVSAPWLLYLRADAESLWETGSAVLINAVVAAALGTGAWLLHRNRASEAAEQGIWSKKTAAVFRVIVGLAAGMCGWGFFVMLVSDSRAVGWGIFGAILAGICTFGVLDIIFQMDFKAFFAHKLQMAVTVAVSLLVCFAFCQDWFGYDTRLPKPGEIAEIAVYDRALSNQARYRYYIDKETLEQMHYQDKENIYAFLERMTEHERENGADSGSYSEATEQVVVKVTLDSGRSYYRSYRIRESDRDVVWPILTSEEYLQCMYLIDDSLIEKSEDFNLYIYGKRYYQELTPEIRFIMEAYNQDLLEDPDRVLLGEGKWVAEIDFRTYVEREDGAFAGVDFFLEIYASMERTVEALRAAGFEPPDIEELGIQSIMLGLDCDENATSEERIALARERYGVPARTEEDGNQSAGREEARADGKDAEMTETSDVTDRQPGAEMSEIITQETYSEDIPVDGGIFLQITDREEMEELFSLLSFGGGYYPSSIFQEDSVYVMSVMKDGSTGEWSIRKGDLPEKYILRFGELSPDRE